MMRRFLATTMLIGCLTAPALAQTAPASATIQIPAAASADAPAGPSYLQGLGPDQYLASRLTGADLFASDQPDAENAGRVDGFVVGADGTLVAAVIDTRAFLGDRSKMVAVPPEKLRWTQVDGQPARGILLATRDELNAAPSFAVTPTAAVQDAVPAVTDPDADDAAMDGDSPPASGIATPDMAASTIDPATASADTASGSGAYIASPGPEQYLTRTLIGESVHAGVTADSDTIGKISDLVLSGTSTLDAVVIGVGGFLGLATKDVAVSFDDIAFIPSEDASPIVSLAATKDELRAAPTFQLGQVQPAADAVALSTGAVTTDGTASASAATGIAAGAAAGSQLATDTTQSAAVATTDPAAGSSSQLAPMSASELSVEDLLGTKVLGPDETTIGSVGDIAMSDQGQVDAIIVDVGGFLGIGAKPVAVTMDNLQFMRDPAGRPTLTTLFTREQLRGAPEYKKDQYATERDRMRLANPDGSSGAGAATGVR